MDAAQLCAEGCQEQFVELVFGETHDAALRALADELRDVATWQELAQRSIAVTADEGSWGAALARIAG